MKAINLLILTFGLMLLCTSQATYAAIAQGSESNTKNGNNALQNNTTGTNNSAYGVQALFSNTTGVQNTAIGAQALYNNQTSATPDAYGDTEGDFNTANGYQALFSNTTGQFNTGVGWQALLNNTIGVNNNAFGFQALTNNVDGIRNCAVGGLGNLTSGDSNTGIGNASLANSAVVNFNTALGRRALFRIQGDQNLGLGFFAGSNAQGGSTNDIYIGNVGPVPVGAESNTIRIGTQISATATVGNPPVESHNFPQHTDTYIAGIFGSSTIAPGMPVYVDSNGKLGTLPSSARFKEDVKPMKDASDEIFSLQPVTFRYKPEVTKSNAAQFGLVAEEVAKVDPNLVVRDATGQIQSVRYEAVNAMVLNELIKEHQQVQNQQKEIDKLTAQLKEQASMLQKVSAQIDLMKSAPRTVADTR